MITNSDFNFQQNDASTLELPFSEHIEELRQRLFHIVWVILILTCVTRKAMEQAAKDLDFIKAASLRDTIKILQEKLK